MPVNDTSVQSVCQLMTQVYKVYAS